MPAVKTGAASSESVQRTRNSAYKHVWDHKNGAIYEPSDNPTPRTAYPLEGPARAAFRTPDGKKLTEHQWAVYDVTQMIPRGHVTTYAEVCKAVGKGSPRSIGAVLRHNPFSPVVPCHRVIESNHFIGGFFGEWDTIDTEKYGEASGKQCQRKMDMLAKEGVRFTAKGFLVDESLLWTLYPAGLGRFYS